MSRTTPYRLNNQIGFILRQTNQRCAALFVNGIGNGLTPTRWAALVRLGETRPYPQNRLGQLTAIDTAAVKSVVERLNKRELIQHSAGPGDGQRLLVSLSPVERAELKAGLATAREINRQALTPPSPQEQEALHGLLTRLI